MFAEECREEGTVLSLHLAICRFIIMCDLAMQLVTNPYFQAVVFEAIRLGAKRNTFNFESLETTKRKYLEGGIFLQEEIHIQKRHEHGVTGFGSTLVFHGGKNEVVVGMETPVGFFLYRSGGVGQNTAFYHRLGLECLNPPQDSPFRKIARSVTAVVTDGASASVQGAELLKEGQGLVPVLCQSHAIHCMLIHLFERVPALKAVYSKTEALFKAFCDVGWAAAMLEQTSKLVLHRLVESRMLVNIVVFTRIVRMQDDFIKVIHKKDFKAKLE